MLRIRLNLDKKTDADIILELENRANGGSLSRALYRVLCEWFYTKSETVPILATDEPNLATDGPDVAKSGQNDITESLANLDEACKDWE